MLIVVAEGTILKAAGEGSKKNYKEIGMVELQNYPDQEPLTSRFLVMREYAPLVIQLKSVFLGFLFVCLFVFSLKDPNWYKFPLPKTNHRDTQSPAPLLVPAQKSDFRNQKSQPDTVQPQGPLGLNSCLPSISLREKEVEQILISGNLSIWKSDHQIPKGGQEDKVERNEVRLSSWLFH